MEKSIRILTNQFKCRSSRSEATPTSRGSRWLDFDMSLLGKGYLISAAPAAQLVVIIPQDRADKSNGTSRSARGCQEAARG
jgi:hypothetical protein